jgi:hypothetical protein
MANSVPMIVIPAKAGIQKYDLYDRFWIPHQVRNDEKKAKKLFKIFNFVILACPESFFKMDSRQAGVTDKETIMA